MDLTLPSTQSGKDVNEEYDSAFLVNPSASAYAVRKLMVSEPEEYRDAVAAINLPPPSDHEFPDARPIGQFHYRMYCQDWREQLQTFANAVQYGMQDYGDMRVHWSTIPKDTNVLEEIKKRLQNLGYTHIFYEQGEMRVSFRKT